MNKQKTSTKFKINASLSGINMHQRSDAQLIYDLLVKTKPTRFTRMQLEKALRRDDGSTIAGDSISAILTRFKKIGMVEVIDTIKSRAPIPANVYRFVKVPSITPTFYGKRPEAPVLYPDTQKTATTLSTRLYAQAEHLLLLAAEAEKLEQTPSIDSILSEVRSRLTASLPPSS